MPVNSFDNDLLNQDIVTSISRFLDNKAISIASLVCKQWQSYFTHPAVWKAKLLKDFGISIAALNELEGKQFFEKQFPFQKLYKKLQVFSQNKHQHFMMKYFNIDLADLLVDPLFLVCLLDDKDRFFDHASEVKNHQSWCLINMLIGSNNIINHLLNKYNLMVKDLFYWAICSNDEKTVNLFNQKRYLIAMQETLSPLLKQAVRMGHFEQVQLLLRLDLNYIYTKQELEEILTDVLNKAAESGNRELMQWLLNTPHGINVKLDRNTLYTVPRAVI